MPRELGAVERPPREGAGLGGLAAVAPRVHFDFAGPGAPRAATSTVRRGAGRRSSNAPRPSRRRAARAPRGRPSARPPLAASRRARRAASRPRPPSGPPSRRALLGRARGLELAEDAGDLAQGPLPLREAREEPLVLGAAGARRRGPRRAVGRRRRGHRRRRLCRRRCYGARGCDAAGARPARFLWRCAPGLRVARIASVPVYARERLPRRPGLARAASGSTTSPGLRNWH